LCCFNENLNSSRVHDTSKDKYFSDSFAARSTLSVLRRNWGGKGAVVCRVFTRMGLPQETVSKNSTATKQQSIANFETTAHQSISCPAEVDMLKGSLLDTNLRHFGLCRTQEGRHRFNIPIINAIVEGERGRFGRTSTVHRPTNTWSRGH